MAAQSLDVGVGGEEDQAVADDPDIVLQGQAFAVGQGGLRQRETLRGELFQIDGEGHISTSGAKGSGLFQDYN